VHDDEAVLYGLKFANDIHYKFMTGQVSLWPDSELQTLTEFNAKWRLKVIQSQMGRDS